MDIALRSLKELGCIALLDLNGFMAFNYAHGHDAGDTVLVVIANRLRAGVGDRGAVFRPGGNEFAVLLPGIDLQQSEGLLAELLTAVAEPIPIGQESLAIGTESVSTSATAGLATVTPQNPERSLRLADTALYRAKRQGVPYTVYTHKLPQAMPSLTECLDDYLAWLAATHPEEAWTEVLLLDDCAPQHERQALPPQDFAERWNTIVSTVERDWVNLTFKGCSAGVLVVAVEWTPPAKGSAVRPVHPLSVNFSGKPE